MPIFLAFADTTVKTASPPTWSEWAALAPELGVAALALLVLALEILPFGPWRRLAPAAVCIGLVGIGAGVVVSWKRVGEAGPQLLFNGLIAQGKFFHTATPRLFFLAAALLALWLVWRPRPQAASQSGEFAHLVLVVTVALMLLVQSAHFAMLFVALETVAVGLYVLVAFNRENALSLEAGAKYLVLGGLGSALMLFGIALLCGVAGSPLLAGGNAGLDSLDFTHIGTFLAANSTNPLALAGIGLVLVGVAFKIGMFPFQIWVPDVYQGAPTPTVAFLAVASKAAGTLALFILLRGPFAPMVLAPSGQTGALHALVALMAGATLVFSNLSALGQTNVKRLMGLSGVSHAGFLVMGVLSAQHKDATLALPAIAVYLTAYLAGVFTTLGVVTEMTHSQDDGEDDSATQEISDYQLLSSRNPFLAGMLGIGVGSLAGIPPSLGFIAKFLIITAAFQAGLWTLAALALLCVCAGVYYYFSWIREAFQHVWISEERRAELSKPIHVPPHSKIVLWLLALTLLTGGVAQGLLLTL
ncbi:MAG: NADH-quinone oxidoreductase subunit N [Puniceicoccales bacterium]|jgi:NADH-quinone oxidoreductase subunit N|nr:NADH-quinone oxidoreductase subunit N [Puniceicoccales bacterium]